MLNPSIFSESCLTDFPSSSESYLHWINFVRLQVWLDSSRFILCNNALSLIKANLHIYYPAAVAWLQATLLASGQCKNMLCEIQNYSLKPCTDLLATSPAALHDHLHLHSPPKLKQKGRFVKLNVTFYQPRRTVLCMLSMDPQCTQILHYIL